MNIPKTNLKKDVGYNDFTIRMCSIDHPNVPIDNINFDE
jgi:hypothetical protein